MDPETGTPFSPEQLAWLDSYLAEWRETRQSPPAPETAQAASQTRTDPEVEPSTSAAATGVPSLAQGAGESVAT